MKRIAFALFLIIGLVSCDPKVLESVIATIPQGSPGLSNADVISGLKEALRVGTENAVGFTSRDNGFYGNQRIRIPFPEEAIKVKNAALQIGLDKQVNDFEVQLNRAAERAAKEAIPVFVNAITSMTIEDGFAILKGDSLAATQFLKRTTSQELTLKFRPVVDRVIQEIKLTDYWSPLAKAYNSASVFTGGQQVNPDLGAYVTERALSGLFIYVGEEEIKIRKDPKARVSDILVRVFGSTYNRY